MFSLGLTCANMHSRDLDPNQPGVLLPIIVCHLLNTRDTLDGTRIQEDLIRRHEVRSPEGPPKHVNFAIGVGFWESGLPTTDCHLRVSGSRH